MAGSSSINPCGEEEHQYPYPSNVFVPSFVSVKLSGRDMYCVWETQILCLLVSHGMMGFIDGKVPSPVFHDHEGKNKNKKKVEDVEAWRRSDALVKGWILGSLSEPTLRYVVNLAKKNVDFTAKDVWEKLQTLHGPAPLLQEAAAAAEEKWKEKEKKKGADERDKVHQSLYEATLHQSNEDIDHILKTKKVKVTDKITINGNTAVHVAVGTTKKREFLEKMLNLAEQDNPQLDMRNSEGSTLLHVASIVGNTEAAKILMGKNPNLFFARDKEDQTPVARAVTNMHTETYLYLLNLTDLNLVDIEMGSLLSEKAIEELLVNAISSKDFDTARRFLSVLSYMSLLSERDTLHSDAVLMAMAQNFPSKLNTWETIVYKVWPFKFLHLKFKERNVAGDLLWRLCKLIISNHSNSVHQYYTNPILEATRQNAYEVVETLEYHFPDAIWSTNEDGHNIIQYAVINRSEKVYNLLYQMSEHRNIYKTIKDSSGNNLLHLAATLTPTNKLTLISGAALQIQRELQWFHEVERFVCPLNIMQKNSFKETPQMIFTRDHKELLIEGEKWMKATAESYTITAALITTIMFAAAITVPGGNNQDSGIPVFTHNAAFSIFAVSDAISLFTSVTSLLMFLSILTARFAEQDFLFKLPTKLVIGLVTLFVSTTAMIVAFSATLFLLFGESRSWILVPIAVLTCLPITSFVTLQLPLLWEFISATYGRSIFGKKSDRPFY